MKPRASLVLRNVALPGGRTGDVEIQDGIVGHIGAGARADETLDCTGLLVLPAAVDIHVHMRGGPQSAKEDWTTGSRSALAGGVTVVVDQPNTVPPITTPESFRNRVEDAREHSLCNFAINSAVTSETPFSDMWGAGATAFGETFFAPSSYGDAVDEATLVTALGQISALGALATIHAEEVTPGDDDTLLSHDILRSPAGELRAVEAVNRCNTRGCRLHFCHLSSSASIDAAPGTVEVTPHHLFLSSDRFESTDTFAKMNPPLRSEMDCKSLWTRWKKISVIASDHAPHTKSEKNVPFASAPSGVPGVETMVPLLLAEVLKKRIPLADLILKTSVTPSLLMGIPSAGFIPGNRGDFALYPKEPVPIDPDNLHSRCGWTPFEGMPAVFPSVVVMGGQVVFRDGEFLTGTSRWIAGNGYNPG
ncbi:dihydroorotase [uncultured Methanoregula sp.]|uniref:dihydroorotase n=1 Tax=uncultured Methanoregula sp. TaxID=1005933 RepID=UPI002AAC1129|nr:dihydroorotase [uncultured Methanoregula sp.]